MKLKPKKRYIIFPHLSVSLYLHIGIIILIVLVYSFLYKDNGDAINAVLRICSIVLPILLVIMFISLNILFWNTMIIMDSDKMVQRRGLHKKIIFWNQNIDIRCTKGVRTYSTAATLSFAPKVTFITANSGSLSIVMETKVYNVLQMVCPNKEILMKIQRAAC